MQPNANSVQPDASPMQPNLSPVQPNATPVQPNATPVQPNAIPVQPNVTHDTISKEKTSEIDAQVYFRGGRGGGAEIPMVFPRPRSKVSTLVVIYMDKAKP